MTSGGREVDVGGGGGAVPDYKYGRNKLESEFLTGVAEYSQSCEGLGSCLAIERSMIKSNTLFTLFMYLSANPSPPPCVHLAST